MGQTHNHSEHRLHAGIRPRNLFEMFPDQTGLDTVGWNAARKVHQLARNRLGERWVQYLYKYLHYCTTTTRAQQARNGSIEKGGDNANILDGGLVCAPPLPQLYR